MLTLCPPPASVVAHLVDGALVCPERGNWPGGTYWGDGSGGPFSSHADLRRVGCGLAALTDALAFAFCAYFALPGDVQPVPRSELFALVMRCLLLQEGCAVVYCADSKLTFAGVIKGEDDSGEQETATCGKCCRGL